MPCCRSERRRHGEDVGDRVVSQTVETVTVSQAGGGTVSGGKRRCVGGDRLVLLVLGRRVEPGL